jgi:AraC-like DNA-binding protein
MIICGPSGVSSEIVRSRIASAVPAENSVIYLQAKSLEYNVDFAGPGVRCVWGGREVSIADGKRWTVDDDTWLFLPRAKFLSQLNAHENVTSLTLLFREGLVEEVAAAVLQNDEKLIDTHDVAAPVLWAWPHLQVHDRAISAVLQFIRRNCEVGLDDPLWYEEQLGFLLERMIARHRSSSLQAQKLAARRSSTRKEIIRRLSLATDFIHGNYERSLSLADMADAAHLSRHHFLRLFKTVNDVTPYEYLQRKRTTVAARLLRNLDLPVEDVVRRVGFDSRSTLFRALRRFHGVTPTQCRRIVEPLAFAAQPQASC